MSNSFQALFYPNWRTDRLLLLLGGLAAWVAAVGDVLLLYHPMGNYLSYTFLEYLPMERVGVGHFLGIFSIPFELLGLWVVAKSFHPLGLRAIALAFGAMILITAWGTAYHGLVFFVAQLVQKGVAIEDLRIYFEPLGNGMVFCFSLLALYYLFLLQKGRTALRAWTIAINPVILYLIFIAGYIVWPRVGNLLIVAGFNLAIALFLTILACTYTRAYAKQTLNPCK